MFAETFLIELSQTESTCVEQSGSFPANQVVQCVTSCWYHQVARYILVSGFSLLIERLFGQQFYPEQENHLEEVTWEDTDSSFSFSSCPICSSSTSLHLKVSFHANRSAQRQECSNRTGNGSHQTWVCACGGVHIKGTVLNSFFHSTDFPFEDLSFPILIHMKNLRIFLFPSRAASQTLLGPPTLGRVLSHLDFRFEGVKLYGCVYVDSCRFPCSL